MVDTVDVMMNRRSLLAVTAASLTAGRLHPAAAQEALAIGNPDIPHSTDTSKGTVTFYSSWPMGGAYKQLGGDAVDAIRFALGQLGNAGGGYAIKYEPLDDGVVANGGGWDAAAESANAIKAINDPSCMAYIGTYNSGAAKISIPMTNQAGLAMMSPNNKYPGFTLHQPPFTAANEPDIYYPTGTRTYFRNNADDIFCSTTEAQWMHDQGWDRVYILHDQSMWGKVVSDIFLSEFESLGGTIVGYEGYDPRGTDYMALMASVVDAEPGVIYFATNPESNPGKVIQDARAYMDEEVRIFVPATLNDAVITSSGDAAEGLYFSTAGLSPDDLVALGGPCADFVLSFRERHGRDPDFWALHAYELVYVLVQAMDAAGTNDRAAFLNALSSTTNFRSPYGNTWSFTETGDPDNFVFAIYQFSDGRLNAYDVLDAAETR